MITRRTKFNSKILTQLCFTSNLHFPHPALSLTFGHMQPAKHPEPPRLRHDEGRDGRRRNCRRIAAAPDGVLPAHAHGLRHLQHFALKRGEQR